MCVSVCACVRVCACVCVCVCACVRVRVRVLARPIGVSHECVGDDSCAVCGEVLQYIRCLVWWCADPHLAELVLLTYITFSVYCLQGN